MSRELGTVVTLAGGFQIAVHELYDDIKARLEICMARGELFTEFADRADNMAHLVGVMHIVDVTPARHITRSVDQGSGATLLRA
jgi:hypothetical protein